MKRLLYLLPLTGLFACSPRLRTTEYVTYPSLADTAFVVVLEENDRFSGGAKTGIVRSTDNVILPACSYDDILARMKQAARASGANIIKITAHNSPDRDNRCEFVSAGLYKVDNPRPYERKFPWSADRPLTWEDYKGSPNSIREAHVGARTSCRFGIKIDTVSTPGKINVIVTNEFICAQSSIKSSLQTPALLAHEQLHFDLCEVYARSLRKTLSTQQFSRANVARISKDAFLQTYQLYRDQQALYDLETEHGLNADAQQRWNRKIGETLTNLHTYAQ